MKRIQPLTQMMTFLRDYKTSTQPSIGELGIYGVYSNDGSQVIDNRVVGYLMRSKSADINEGGVASESFVINAVELE